MNTGKLDDLYAKLMGPIMNSLLIEMLVLGVFFVLYSYVRVVLKDPKILTSRNFIVRLVLLGDIVLFNVFIAVSYFLDYSNVSLEELIQYSRQLSDSDYHRERLIFFFMVPIDVATVVAHVSMYAVISLTDETNAHEFRFAKDDIRRTIRNLFLIGIIFHLVSMSWWVTLSVLTKSGFPTDDGGFHFLYALIYSIGYFIAKKSRPKDSTDLILVGYYSLAMLSVYVFRTMTFMDRLFRN